MRESVWVLCFEVAREYEVGVDEIRGRSKSRSVKDARHVAMWLARRRLGLSYPELGREFGKDHTTVRSAVLRVDCATGSELERLWRLEETLAAGEHARDSRWAEIGAPVKTGNSEMAQT